MVVNSDISAADVMFILYPNVEELIFYQNAAYLYSHITIVLFHVRIG